ncbi:MAG: hypothetical protein ING36_01205 [Burkholderiales bacterium]|jgi:hypothetical protein|nr:hypothetical protein [Burkholderiales bacterium]MCA3160791.1 hypothetical protein [Burkholderiales bacterium]MCA3163580.1 hypothetical protein [Burkholderiales bacterium]MCA3166258.1 hypothetical protein [Burkholderiales bacterium]MCA3170116.1 hypothetical protein [Burkholderiales bacterium]
MCRLPILLTCVLVFLTSPLLAQDDWRARIAEDKIRVLPVSGWTILGTISLPLPHAWKVVVSPGGKVVFVLHKGSKALTIIDGETRTVRGTLSLPAEAEDLWFSANGSEVGISWVDGSPASSFIHQKGSLKQAGLQVPPKTFQTAGLEALVRLHPDEGYACF